MFCTIEPQEGTEEEAEVVLGNKEPGARGLETLKQTFNQCSSAQEQLTMINTIRQWKNHKVTRWQLAHLYPTSCYEINWYRHFQRWNLVWDCHILFPHLLWEVPLVLSVCWPPAFFLRWNCCVPTTENPTFSENCSCVITTSELLSELLLHLFSRKGEKMGRSVCCVPVTEPSMNADGTHSSMEEPHVHCNVEQMLQFCMWLQMENEYCKDHLEVPLGLNFPQEGRKYAVLPAHLHKTQHKQQLALKRNTDLSINMLDKFTMHLSHMCGNALLFLFPQKEPSRL